MDPESFVKADGSPLDRPDDAPWPFTILFVGVDNGDKTDPDLNLNREFKKIEQAYREADISRVTSSGVVMKQIFYSKWSDVMMEIRKVKPTILCMGCHAQKGKGFELFRQIVDPHQMLDAIRSWNKSARKQSTPRPEIRIIVSNACDSEEHARVLSEGVDFAIGHRAPVADESAIDFSGIFFDCLFGCDSLMDSFNQAKSCSTGYRLFYPERDPRQFHLVPPGMCLRKRSTSSKHDAGEGSSSGAKRQKQDQVLADKSEEPLQVPSEGVTSKSKRLGKTSASPQHDAGEGLSCAGKKKALPFDSGGSKRHVKRLPMNLDVRSSPGKIRIERFNEERELHTPLTDSFKCMLKGVINRNFAVLLDDAQLLCVADQLKAFDKNVKSTKESEMKEIIDNVIAGSISSSSETPDRTVLESLKKTADDAARDLSKLSDSQDRVVNSRAGGSRQEEFRMLRNRLDVRKETRANATGVTDKEKVDMLMKVIIPAALRKLRDDKSFLD